MQFSHTSEREKTIGILRSHATAGHDRNSVRCALSQSGNHINALFRMPRTARCQHTREPELNSELERSIHVFNDIDCPVQGQVEPLCSIDEPTDDLGIQRASMRGRADNDASQTGFTSSNNVCLHQCHLGLAIDEAAGTWTDQCMDGDRRISCDGHEAARGGEPAGTKGRAELDTIRATGDGRIKPGDIVDANLEQRP